jgi:hypothetical protein
MKQLVLNIMNMYLYFCLSYLACKGRLFYAVSYCHVWPVWLYHILPHYVINGTTVRKKVTGHKMCVLIFSTTLSETLLIRRRIQEDIITYVHKSSCKSTSYSCQTLMTPENFFHRLLKNPEISNFMKIHLVGAKLFHADRDDEANNCLSQVCKHA